MSERSNTAWSAVSMRAAALGAVIGVAFGLTVSLSVTISLGLFGAVTGWLLGQVVGWFTPMATERTEEAEEMEEDEEPEHYRLPKEMRDGYYTGLVMKRIMEVYHPEGEPADEDDETDMPEDEDDEEEAQPAEAFSWAGFGEHSSERGDDQDQ